MTPYELGWKVKVMIHTGMFLSTEQTLSIQCTLDRLFLHSPEVVVVVHSVLCIEVFCPLARRVILRPAPALYTIYRRRLIVG